MKKEDIIKILERLSKKRRLFHSEADFQYSLAWEIKNKFRNCEIRIEKNEPKRNDRKNYVDIFISKGNSKIAIELKYKTSELELNERGENFRLTSQSAQDIGRYDFLKDLYDLEYLKKNKGIKGFAIFLTNDCGYWKESRKGTIDEEFRLFQGNVLKKGAHKWHERTSPGTKKGREKEIDLSKDFYLDWKGYSEIGSKEFKYLLLET